MKRAAQFIITSLFFTFAFIPNGNALVPKAGATCSKTGQVVDYQGKRFTCIKSGTKRVWNKGVAIKATPTPTLSKTASASASTSASASASPSTTSGVKEFTMAQVRANNSASSCWTVIDGDVYDLTKWISSHPGGSGAIRGLCGVDGTQAYQNQHGGSGKTARQLAQFYLGRLKA
jgi:cytochrome b involved in lipid metabolism